MDENRNKLCSSNKHFSSAQEVLETDRGPGAIAVNQQTLILIQSNSSSSKLHLFLNSGVLKKFVEMCIRKSLRMDSTHFGTKINLPCSSIFP